MDALAVVAAVVAAIIVLALIGLVAIGHQGCDRKLSASVVVERE